MAVRNTTLYVSGFDFNTTAEDLAVEFGRFGRLVRCDIPGGKSFAFVEFERIRDAEDAIAAMRGRRINGREITVEFTRRPPPQTWRSDIDGVGGVKHGAPPPFSRGGGAGGDYYRGGGGGYGGGRGGYRDRFDERGRYDDFRAPPPARDRGYDRFDDRGPRAAGGFQDRGVARAPYERDFDRRGGDFDRRGPVDYRRDERPPFRDTRPPPPRDFRDDRRGGFRDDRVGGFRDDRAGFRDDRAPVRDFRTDRDRLEDRLGPRGNDAGRDRGLDRERERRDDDANDRQARRSRSRSPLGRERADAPDRVAQWLAHPSGKPKVAEDDRRSPVRNEDREGRNDGGRRAPGGDDRLDDGRHSPRQDYRSRSNTP